MSDSCTDRAIDGRLSVLDYSFRKSTPEQQELYKKHLQSCVHCSRAAAKAKVKRRAKGLLNIAGGVGLLFASLFIPYPGAWLFGAIAAIVWTGIGLWRLISGRD